jgi:probable phosphoglycerate mutase
MAKILLARHGNTFGPDDTPVWVGAKEDLPLVESGEAQATALGDALNAAGLALGRIVCGPLRRTRRAAEIVAGRTGFAGAPEIDDRLLEIDYGSWGGKSNDQIVAEFGAGALETWDRHHRRPDAADWSPDEAVLKTNALAAMRDAAAGPLTLVITSNGVLRYMHGALAGPGRGAKVKTGHVCAADISGEDGTRLFWNEKPDADLLKRTFG